jgi:hypothetical protein
VTTTTRRGGPVLDTDHQALSRAAHWHADHGMAVFPLAPGRKVPAVEKDWEHEATTDHLAIARTWRQAPYNIGIAAGPSGLLVVDLDQPKTTADLAPEPWRTRGATNGADVLALSAADHTAGIPATYTVATPSGGQHLYYRQPTGHRLGNSAGRIGWKIDTRGHGGYIVGSGSITNQGRYQASNTTPPQPLPDWITTALDTTRPPTSTPRTTASLTNASSYALAALTGELENVLAAAPGQRNDTLNRAAFALGQLVGAQLLDETIARDELLSAAARVGLPRNEAERTITSGLTAGARHPRQRTA